MMVNDGLNEIRVLMSSGTGAPPTVGVVGSHAITPVAGDSALVGSYFGDTLDTNTVADKTNQYELFVAANEGAGTMKAIGIYNADDVMLAEDSFVSITKTGSMEVQFDVNISYVDL